MQKKRIYDIILILGLIGAFGFLGWSIWKNNLPEKTAEIKIIPETVRPAAASVETAKTEDGQQVATFLSYPKYYQNEKKEFVPVETNIVKAEDEPKMPSGQTADWKVDKGVWKLYATNDGAVAADNAGTQLETKLKALVYFDAETKKTSTIYSRDTQQVVVQPVVAQNQIIWPSIIEGIDYKITYINDLLKEEIVMSDAVRQKLPTPESLGIPSDRAYLGFLFERPKEQIGGLETYAVDKDGRKKVEYGNKAFETEGAIEFSDSNGNVIQKIEPGFTSLNPNDQAQSSNQAQNLNEQNSNQLPLLKRFYKENPGEVAGKKFLFSGSKYADIKNLGSGDLLFDPTVSFQKGDGGNYTEVDDTFNNEFGSATVYGTETYIAAYNSGSAQRAIIKFPQLIGMSSGQVPAGSTIAKAQIELTTASAAGLASTASVGIYKVLDQWTEGNCTPCSPTSAGNYGATYDSAQDKYNTETAYINDGDGITASETSVTVDNGSGGNITVSDWPSQGLIQIDSEIMWYTSVTATGFSGLTRGVSGTTAATHADDAVVDGDITWVESGGSAGPAGNSVSASTYATFTPSAIDTAYPVDVTTLVQEWVDDSNNNYGLMVYVNDPDTLFFNSSEYSDVSKRPKLTVLYAETGSGAAGLINAYESADTAVNPSSPGTAVTVDDFELATKKEDSGFWTTALSETDNGYDSQVFKMQVPSATSTAPITVNWKGHGESAATNNNVSLNIWNFDSSSWEELDSGAARYNDTFTDKTSALNTAASWGASAVDSVVFDSVNNMIYAGGGSSTTSKFARYSPSGDSFTNLSAKSDNEIFSMAFDSANKEIYLGEYSGVLEKYNPVTDTVTVLTSKISSFWSTNAIYSLVFDSKNNIVYLGGLNGKFAKFNPATGVATDLTSALNTATSWSTGQVFALAFDSTNKTIYLGGSGAKFAKYDPAANSFTDLTATLNWSGSSPTVQTLAFDSVNNAIYVMGGINGPTPRFSKYTPSLNAVDDLINYLPATLSGNFIYGSAFDPSAGSIYQVGNGYVGARTRVTRYFPATMSSQSLTNSVFDALGDVPLKAAAFDTTNKVLYLGGDSGKFGKYAVSSNTALSGTVSSAIKNYRDSSGYAWLWVKATNEWSPPSVTGVSSGVNPITWTSGEGADGAVAKDVNVSHSAGSWSDYPSVLYEPDAGWKTSHSVSDPSACDQTIYYRVRSCDQWGSCTVSAEYSYANAPCGGTCLHLYLWDGQKWDFKTDTFASGTLGYKKGDVQGFVKPIPNEIYAQESLTPKDGQIEMREFSDLPEINYFDNMTIYSYLIPEDRHLGFENPSVGSPADMKPVPHTIGSDLILPRSAKLLDTGEDVTGKIKEADGQKIILNSDKEKYDYKTLEVDFGDLADLPQKKLVVTGSSAFPDTLEGIKRKMQFGPAQKLSFQDGDGNWVDVPPGKVNFVKPYSFDRQQVMDISNIFISSSTKLRITYLYKTYLDQIAIDGTLDSDLKERSIVPLDSAVLQSRNNFHPFDRDGGKPDFYDTEQLNNENFPGNYTRFGDVTDLVRNQDDKFVIMAKGDEVVAKYQVPTDPIPAGLKRVFGVSTWGYHKAEGKSNVPMTVESLPFAKMSNFPYPAEEYPYANDVDYQNYLATYNTRLLDENHKYTDYLPWQEKINSDVQNIFEKGKELLDNFISQSEFDISGKKVVGEYTMHAENSNGSADTDFIEMSVDSETRLKGGITLPGGVRLK